MKLKDIRVAHKAQHVFISYKIFEINANVNVVEISRGAYDALRAPPAATVTTLAWRRGNCLLAFCLLARPVMRLPTLRLRPPLLPLLVRTVWHDH